MRQLPLGVRLRERAVFASFVAGPNSEACAHLQAVADAKRRGVTWLCGASGVGKTHLLQATCAAAATARRATYLPLADLSSAGPHVLEGLGDFDCLCLDDIDRVAGARAWERALFELYVALDERGGALVVAAQDAPAAVAFGLKDLASRLAAGAVHRLQVLDEDQQRQALQRRAQLRGIELPDETVQYLQRRVPRDMPSLCRLLDDLDEASLRAQRRLTVPFIRSVLGDVEKD